jgi:hypothetical protein
MVAGLIAGALGVWFVLSVLGQFDWKLVQRIRAHDQFALIPRWTFFAPRPGVTDYHLVYQTLHDGAASPWREESLADLRTIRGAIWNPEKRNRKALIDSVRSFVRMAQELEKDAIWQLQYTIPYIAVLSYLTDVTRDTGGDHIRFMILESHGFYTDEEPRLLFKSAVHAT